METRQLYALLGGDYDDALERMMMDTLVVRFLKLFPEDSAFEKLRAAMTDGDMEAAFRGAHSLKGVCANLSLTRLGGMASDLTEALRYGRDIPRAMELYPMVAACYEETVRIIRENL